jgi:hypothetical protein
MKYILELKVTIEITLSRDGKAMLKADIANQFWHASQ